MHWLQSVDVSLFKFINVGLSSPVFDRVMPFLSGNRWFVPILIVGSVLLLWKGRRKGLVCLLMLILIVSVGDGFVCRNLKAAVARERPCWVVDGVNCLVGKSHSG